jgi:formamidopyrimidine-DNA glycosylase
VDEALFQAGIHPVSQAAAIPEDSARRLFRAIQQILADSIAAQGTTVFNFSHGDNQSGTYQAALQVYQRQGQPCLVCNTPLEKIKLAQRGTHFCPVCQIVY